MTTGTSHFVSLAAAVAYYRPYLGEPVFAGGDATPQKTKRQLDRENAAAVQQKLDAGEIHIGPPQIKPAQRLQINRSEGRYFITES
jgi:hypothetical protein